MVVGAETFGFLLGDLVARGGVGSGGPASGSSLPASKPRHRRVPSILEAGGERGREEGLASVLVSLYPGGDVMYVTCF